nr:MAG TPA: hypothetical protein [Caudoviricetes sp.]
MKKEDRVSYEELIEVLEDYHIKEKFSVVAYLIGRRGYVNREDFENIQRLYTEGYLNK